MILRIASLYGDGLKKQLIYDACSKISKGINNFYGTGREKRDFIHISDLVNIVSYFCTKGFSNQYYKLWFWEGKTNKGCFEINIK